MRRFFFSVRWTFAIATVQTTMAFCFFLKAFQQDPQLTQVLIVIGIIEI